MHATITHMHTHTRARARTHTHAHTHVQDMKDARCKMQNRIAVSLPLVQPIRYNTQTTSMTENHQYDKGWRLDRGLCARSMGTARHQLVSFMGRAVAPCKLGLNATSGINPIDYLEWGARVTGNAE